MPRLLHHRHPVSGREDGAYRKLRELIITLKLAPGSPLIEADLSRRLGFSRTPIRAGLRRLQQEGIVVTSQNGRSLRAVVGPLTLADMKEVYIIEGALEGAAARLAAELAPEKRLLLAKEMKALNNELRGLGVDRTVKSVRDASDLHVRFHRSFVEASAGPRLMAQIEAVQAQVERYERAYTTALRTRFDPSVAEHDAIIAAIETGDGEAAEQAALSNWRNGAVRHGAIIASLGELGNW